MSLNFNVGDRYHMHRRVPHSIDRVGGLCLRVSRPDNSPRDR